MLVRRCIVYNNYIHIYSGCGKILKLGCRACVSHLIMYCYYSVAMGIGRGYRSDMAPHSLKIHLNLSLITEPSDHLAI